MTKRGTTSTALHMTTRGGLEFTVPVGARCIGRRLESGTRAPIAIWEIDPSSCRSDRSNGTMQRTTAWRWPRASSSNHDEV